MLLVLPPDGPAREAILGHHLRDRPVGDVDLGKLAAGDRATTPGPTSPTSATTAAERALAASMRTGRLVPLDHQRPAGRGPGGAAQHRPWFATARNVALFGNDGRQLRRAVPYLKRKHRS